MALGSQSESPPNDADKARGKKRIRNFTAEERAAHRIIEKQRRDALNESFLDLARLIPALAPCRRLSKSLIVHESVQYLQTQREAWIAAAEEIRALMAENMQVVAEVNTWRELHGLTPQPVLPVGDKLKGLLDVKKDVLGTFPGGFGDNLVEGENGNGSRRESEVQIEEAMQLDQSPSKEVHKAAPAPVIPKSGPSRPILPHLQSSQSNTFVQNIGANEPPNTVRFMDESLITSSNNGPFQPHHDPLYMESLLDAGNQTFPDFNAEQSIYPNFDLVSPDLDFYLTANNGNGMYFDNLNRAQHTQHS